MISGFVAQMDDEAKVNWAAKQCYIALGNLVTVCAIEKIDACPIEGFSPEQFDEILELKEKNLRSVVMAAIGFRSEEDKYQHLEKVRKPLNEMIIEF